MKDKKRYFTFERGLQNTSFGRSGRVDDFFVFQDVDVDHGDIESRKGRVLLARVANATSIMAFDGVNDRVDFPAELALDTILGLYWTVEILFKTTTLAANHFVIGSATGSCGLTVKQTTGSAVVVTVKDSAAASVALTHSGVAAATLCGLQVTRSGSVLTSYLNADVQTGTMSATNLLATGAISAGTDNGANWHLGAIDTFRGWTVARTTRRDLYQRRMNPRAKDCLWDFDSTDNTAHDWIDKGRNQYHAVPAGSPAFNAAALANNASQVQGLGYSVRKNGTREVVAVIAGTAYSAAVS